MLKTIFSRATIALFLFTLTIPGFVFSQQKQPSQPPVGRAAVKPPAGAPAAGRRGVRADASHIPLIERDLDEALQLIREKYIEGKKLDYNSVFKSSIIGMLRSLDPHSNYYDREEFDDLKTDQRSEYFGIGASIQNYTIGGDTDTYIAATFDRAPANRAGLRFGDRILEVDGVKMEGKPSIDVRD